MCTEVRVLTPEGPFDCDNIAELAAVLGVAPSVVSDDPPDHCLCNAHLDALGARRATEAEGWPFPEYVIERGEGAIP